MPAFAKKSKAGSQTSRQQSSKQTGRPFFDQSPEVNPFFQKQPDVKGASADKSLRRLDFRNITRPPSNARFRVPSSADLQGIMTSGTVDEAVVLSRVRKLLERMYREGRLYFFTSSVDSDMTTDIDTAMAAIFPSPGHLDQAAFERYIDPSNRKMVYESIDDSYTTPDAKDHAKLKKGLQAAAATAGTVANDKTGLEAVFGNGKRPVLTKGKMWSFSITNEKYVTTAQQNYRTIQSRLNYLATNIDANISTDYNLDSQETFVGGWAAYDDQELFIMSTVVSDPETPHSKTILLHEAAHLSNSDIVDHVYYGTSGYESAEEETKINNAAHYEELPRRDWGVSKYAGKTFTPGVSGSGKTTTTEEKVKNETVNYYRMAWDAAVTVHDLLKYVYLQQADGERLGETWLEEVKTLARLLEVSQLMDLTLHEQSKVTPQITLLDVTTAESIARGVGLVEGYVKQFPDGTVPDLAMTVRYAVSLSVDDALAAYGGLLGDAARDRKLVDWLHDHYKNVYV